MPEKLFEPMVFVDLETTGATGTVDRITEIGIVEVNEEGEVREWSSLVNPQTSIPPFIQNLTGISDAMVAEAPTFEELAEEVLMRLHGRLFVAHNARFDYGFLKNEFKRVGVDFKATVLCTVKLSRKLFPQFSKHSLDALIERHGLVCSARHRAMGDVDAVLPLAPGHVPENFYQISEVRRGIDGAHQAVQAGQGDTLVEMTDINQGQRRQDHRYAGRPGSARFYCWWPETLNFVQILVDPDTTRRRPSTAAELQANGEESYQVSLHERHANEFARRVRAGEFKDRAEKMAYLHRFEAVLAEEETSWRRLQVSVVAGAGFEPAAFRL